MDDDENEHTIQIPKTGINTLPVGTVLEEFEILSVIGQGGFGIVYRAFDKKLEREVALKEYLPFGFAARESGSTVVKTAQHHDTFEVGMRSFINEAKLLAQFHHPSLINVYRRLEANGTAYMAMHLYKSPTLKKYLEQLAEPPDEVWLKSFLKYILEALEVIHAENCYHRDISPDNILILNENKPLLLDFGAARYVIRNSQQTPTTIFKAGYAPIEQCGDSKIKTSQGAWTDFYALGAVIYFVVMGKRPVSAVTRALSDTLEPLASFEFLRKKYSLEFLCAIDRALAFKPADRPQNVEEFRKLLNLHTDPSSEITRIDPTESLNNEKKSFKKIIISTSLALIFLVTFIVYTIEPTEPVAKAEKVFTPLKVLDDIFEMRDPSHAVSISIKKAKIRIDMDPLQFSINSAKSGYIYVLMVGSNQNDFYMLFPNNLDSMNRIEAGNSLDLPRKDWKMLAAGPPGINHFIVIISDQQRDFSAAGLTNIDPFSKFPYEHAEYLYRNYTGILPLFAGKAICQKNPANACSESYGAAVFSIEEIEP